MFTCLDSEANSRDTLREYSDLIRVTPEAASIPTYRLDGAGTIRQTRASPCEGGLAVWEALSRVHEEGSLVDLRRDDIPGGTIRGFLAAVSAEFVVVSEVDDQCHFDGTTVLRKEDITLMRWDTEVLRAWTRLLQESPSSPPPVRHLDLTSWESLVRSVAGREHVVTFHRELLDDTCHVGINVEVEGESVIADEVSIEGTIDGRFALKVSDLTQVEFGGGYEQSLWRMVQSSKA